MIALSSKEPVIYIDGKFYPKSEARISVFDHGLLYGDGVFEGIRSYGGYVFKLREHVDRLYRSAHSIQLTVPLSKEELIEAVLETIRRNDLEDAYVRLVVTRGSGDLGIDPRKCPRPTAFIIAEPLKPLHGVDAKEKGITAIISSIRKDRVDSTSREIKSLNYLNSILAEMEAIDSGVHEVIMLDARGFVSEAATSNLFIVKDGELITPPPTAGLLHGITRQRVMQLAEEIEIPLTVRDITPYELINAEEVFLTGTYAEVAPVVKIKSYVIGDGKVGPVTRRIIEEFQKIVRDPREGVPLKKK